MGVFTTRQRQRHQGSATGALRDFLDAPVPHRRTPAAELALLAVDFETTGLDAATGHLLSIGFVAVNGTEIDLSSARSYLIKVETGVGQSATVHGLTDDRVATGCDLADAVSATLTALRGRVMLAHFTSIEESFLDRACQQIFGVGVQVPSVDTMMLHRHLLDVGNHQIGADSVRLWPARAWFGLPIYQAHEALTDALACAELYLAQISRMGDRTPLSRLQRWST
jgi:DNA polymerase III subunit epsilon